MRPTSTTIRTLRNTTQNKTANKPVCPAQQHRPPKRRQAAPRKPRVTGQISKHRPKAIQSLSSLCVKPPRLSATQDSVELVSVPMRLPFEQGSTCSPMSFLSCRIPISGNPIMHEKKQLSNWTCLCRVTACCWLDCDLAEADAVQPWGGRQERSMQICVFR